LFLAAFLDTEIYDVSIYEKKKSLGRKFLVAGDGGFNLTHSEDLVHFKSRYTPPSYLDHVLDVFDNQSFRTWLLKLGIPTFVGSSGRVFPEKGIKPIEVLRSIETHLINNGVKFQFNKSFTNWGEDNSIELNSGEIVKADYTVFALGGASWKVTGSDGSWLSAFKEKGISTLKFKPANCAYQINWNERFIQKHEGKPLKNISISINAKTQKGEAVITKFGIEGNAIYGLSPDIQANLDAHDKAIVHVDLKPHNDLSDLINKLNSSKTNITTTLKEKVKLSRPIIDLIKSTLSKEEFLDTKVLAKTIKSFPLIIVGSASVDEAISTTGGISLEAVDTNFELKKIKNNFCIGEMLDWNAPTGGYLIQACASSGVYLAKYLNKINNPEPILIK
jgi:uncharacterized flavoprotein (TIGR03862 family)